MKKKKEKVKCSAPARRHLEREYCRFLSDEQLRKAVSKRQRVDVKNVKDFNDGMDYARNVFSSNSYEEAYSYLGTRVQESKIFNMYDDFDKGIERVMLRVTANGKDARYA